MKTFLKITSFILFMIAIDVAMMVGINQLWTGNGFIIFDLLFSMIWGAGWSLFAMSRWAFQ